MSYTTVSETSIEAHDQIPNRLKKIQQVEDLLRSRGPMTAVDVAIETFDISRTRLIDAQRIFGSVLNLPESPFGNPP